MISEVLNALLLTYLATEYLLWEEKDSNRTTRTRIPNNHPSHHVIRSMLQSLWIQKRHSLYLVGLVAGVNLAERVSGMGHVVHNVLSTFLHLPKFVLAATAYLGALYVDCSRTVRMHVCRDFLPKLAYAACLHLPLYPFLAVLISFGFLFVINLFEFFQWPLEVLNMPIYYGTLYGPLSFLYYAVKKSVLQQQSSLPS